MKSLRTMLFGSLLILVLISVSCGKKDKYDMARDVIGKQVAILEDYIAEMEKADNAQAVAKAINAYSVAQSKLGPAIKEVQEKFPEMNQSDEPPAELKAEMDKFQLVMKRMIEMSMKASQFMSDPEVMAAQQNLQKAMETTR